MKQYLTKEEIKQATIEELQNNIKAIHEELNQLKDFPTEEGKERFRELVHLRILSNIRINLLLDSIYAELIKALQEENEYGDKLNHCASNHEQFNINLLEFSNMVWKNKGEDNEEQ